MPVPNQGQLRPYSEYAEVGLKVWDEEGAWDAPRVFKSLPVKFSSISFHMTQFENQMTFIGTRLTQLDTRARNRPDGKVLWIAFDRPTKMNSLSWPLTSMFHEICDKLMMNRTIRVVVLTSVEGSRNFSAGGSPFCFALSGWHTFPFHLVADNQHPPPFQGLDFGSNYKEVYQAKDPNAHVPPYFGQRNYSLMASKLIAIPQMVVAAAHGPTVGVGFALFCSSDIRIASEDWRASIGANRMGLSGGEGGLSWLLPKLVGQGLATELMATHRWVDAQKALQRGLLTELVKTKEDLRPAARQFAKDMLALSQTGLILTKQLIALNMNGSSMQGAVAAEDSAQVSNEVFGTGFRWVGNLTKYVFFDSITDDGRRGPRSCCSNEGLPKRYRWRKQGCAQGQDLKERSKAV